MFELLHILVKYYFRKYTLRMEQMAAKLLALWKLQSNF